MENFEYSILLNDRDWAEFDLDSDECSLIPPALATAEDQVLSDLEEGEAEEDRLVRVRVSPLLPAREAAKCLSRGAPDTRLLAEDIWSGREDETDLASVNSGINSQAGAVLSPPDCAREQQLPCASSQPLQSPGGQAGPDAEGEVAVAFNAMEGEPDTGGRPLNPGCPSDVVAGSPFQEEDSQEQGLARQSAEGPTAAGYISLDATGRTEKPMEGTKDVGCRIVQERGQGDYGRCSACVKVEHPFLAGREGNVHFNATQGADSRCDEALDKHRETVVLAETVEESSGGDPFRHFEMEVPVGDETYPVITGDRRPELGEPSILCGLTLDGPPESSFTDLTWPEMYDYFFCNNTGEGGGEARRDGCSAPCLAAELPDMCGPEMYEYFFDEMDLGEEGHRDDASEAVLGFDHRSTLQGGLEGSSPTVAAADAVQISTPEVYEHFFADGAKGRRNWRGFLRRLTAAEAKKAARAVTSFLSRPVRRLRSQPTSRGALLRRSSHGRLVLLSPRILDERPEIGGMAVMEPERPLSVQPVLTQRDMCLGFVAFASWAVKTSDLRAPDAWKIVLLANFGTLSAIRYFRRQVVTERWHDT